MVDFDLILRQGTVMRPDGPVLLDLGVWDGKITALKPNLSGSALAEIDASNR